MPEGSQENNFIHSANSIITPSVSVSGRQVLAAQISVSEKLAEPGHFSFIWRQPPGEAAMQDHIDFYRTHMGAEVSISLGSEFRFNGYIMAISCTNLSATGVEYEVSGKGIMCKLEGGGLCRSHRDKTLSNIVSETIDGLNLENRIEPTNTRELYYTVQYNQSNFEFLHMLASRYGEWFYSTGTCMVFGAPDADTIDLQEGLGLIDWTFSAKMVPHHASISAFNLYEGEGVFHEQVAEVQEGLLGAMQGATQRLRVEERIHSPSDVVTALTEQTASLFIGAHLSNAVLAHGSSYDTRVRLCVPLNIKDRQGQDCGVFRVVEVHHICDVQGRYRNQFVAIPAANTVPPYSQPTLFPVCGEQIGIVIDNVDEDRLDRVKVRLSWMTEQESTPWLHVAVPYGGGGDRGRGFRFLPEIDDKVLVGFNNNNAEPPYIIGALYNESENSGVDPEGNHIKRLVTRSGRGFIIDDEEETFFIMDNVYGEMPVNMVRLQQGEGPVSAALMSYNDNQNKSGIQCDNSDKLIIRLENGGQFATIRFQGNEGAIKIAATGPIEIESEQDITLKAANIKMEAMGNIELKANTGIKLEGAQIDVEATTAMNAKGAMTTVEGSAMLELKGGGMAKLQGGVVMIN